MAGSASFSRKNWAPRDPPALNSPRIGIPFFVPSGLPDTVHEAGGEPISLRLPEARPEGVALAREWISDLATVSCAHERLDALLVPPGKPEEMFGLLLAAGRLNLPTVCGTPADASHATVLASLGLISLNGQPSATALALASERGPLVRDLVENFSLANAVRVTCAAGGGLELLVHLSAMAREAGVAGFSQMIRVLSGETLAVTPEWLRDHGSNGLLAYLGDTLHNVPTVAGRLKENLPEPPQTPKEHSRIVFARARSSGAEAVCRVGVGETEAAGECRVFDSEEAGVRAVASGEIGEDVLIVVRGCGARGGPGLLRLDALAGALRESGLSVPVLTDGIVPEGAQGVWASLFAPEAATGGVIGRLHDGDALRLDFSERRIRTAVGAEELARRKPFEARHAAGRGYEARYARSALPAFEGAGFG